MSSKEGRTKRLVIIAIAIFLMVALVVAIAMWIYCNEPVGGDEDAHKQPEATVKAVKTMCASTDYKKTCVETVCPAAGNTTDMKELIKIAFKVAMKNITEAGQRSKVLLELQDDPRTRKALEDCQELMNSAVEECQQSFDRMQAMDILKIDEMLEDLKIWISAASSDQEACLDGFHNTTGDAAEKMRSALKFSMRMTSNSLAIVTDLSSVLTSVQHHDGADGDGRRRRLMGESWTKAGMRRLLEAKPKPEFVVAEDGSGNYKTIGEALENIPLHSEKPVVIYVKTGSYEQFAEVRSSMTHVLMIGDGAEKTRITGHRNFLDGTTTFRTASFAVKGDFFMAKNIGFENTAGPEKHQAVALRVQSDMSIFYNCTFDGYQDTLYTHTKRQFYRDCTISGTIDFVFGNAAAVFQNCLFRVRMPLSNQKCIVTAHGRKERRQPTGLVIQNSTFVADRDYFPERKQIKSYLGRPWKEHSRTIIMDSYIDDLIDPEGWLPWNGEYGLRTCYYAELNNHGPGADKAKRVKWKGIKDITKQHAEQYYTAGSFIQGDRWVPAGTGVPYTSGIGGEKDTKTTNEYA